MYTYVCVCMYNIYIHTYMYVCMYVCMYVYSAGCSLFRVVQCSRSLGHAQHEFRLDAASVLDTIRSWCCSCWPRTW